MRIGFIILLLFLQLLSFLQGFEDRSRSLEQRLFAEINDVRIARQLPPLRWNPRIAEPARRHSERMLQQHFLSHDDPEFGGPGNRLSMAGVAWRACAENIYREFGGGDPVRAAVQSWLDSPGHRQNLLSRTYTNTGIGVAIGPRGELIATQLFVAF
jgi:uncharacterized protein YkwD